MPQAFVALIALATIYLVVFFLGWLVIMLKLWQGTPVNVFTACMSIIGVIFVIWLIAIVAPIPIYAQSDEFEEWTVVLIWFYGPITLFFIFSILAWRYQIPTKARINGGGHH